MSNECPVCKGVGSVGTPGQKCDFCDLASEVREWEIQCCKEGAAKIERLQAKVRELEAQNAALSDAEVKRFAAYKESERLAAENAELRAIATDALSAFKCTQRPWEYPETHWSNRLLALRQQAGQEDGQ